MTVDIFVSYTAVDEDWAEWIAWALEDAGFSVSLQKWDFAPGKNFVLEMQKAASNSKRTIAVISPEYLANSRFGASEWAAAFAQDPDGTKGVLVPVRVRDCKADGLLKAIVYIDLVGLDATAAKQRLLDGLAGNRRKPKTPPSYPGGGKAPHPFPGGAVAGSRSRYMPKVGRAISDADRRRFIKDAFQTIKQSFRESLAQLSNETAAVDYDFTDVDAITFTAEAFVNGKSCARCKIWIGGMMNGNDIAYAEGTTALSGNALNESLTLTESDGELRLSSLMGNQFWRAQDDIDPRSMTIEDAAEYLWRRFSSELER